MTNNTSSSLEPNLLIYQPKNQISKNNQNSFEKITVYFSMIGPILIVLFLTLIVPKAIDFFSFSNYSQIHQFTSENHTLLLNLMYLLFTSGIFSLIGLMLNSINKKTSLFIINLISLFVAFGMFIPTWMMIIGD